jgi:hypothetical protein
MTVKRRFLYLGTFFIALGAVVLVAQSDAVRTAIDEAVALWPILVIALGVGLLLRRTRFDLAGGMLAAATPGLLLGGLIVTAPRIPYTDCGPIEPSSFTTRVGTFEGPASVDLRLACGDLTVTAAPGTGWQLQAGSTGAPAPIVDASPDRLSVASATRLRGFGSFGDHDVWRVALPDANPVALAAEIDAGRGRFDLAGARLSSLRVVANAGDVQIDLAGASVADVSVRMNAAKVSLTLPTASDVAADLSVNAGSLRLCAASDTGVRIHQTGVLSSTAYAGLVRSGEVWESPGYASANHHADVTASVNVGSVDLNPVGGCQ